MLHFNMPLQKVFICDVCLERYDKQMHKKLLVPTNLGGKTDNRENIVFMCDICLDNALKIIKEEKLFAADHAIYYNIEQNMNELYRLRDARYLIARTRAKHPTHGASYRIMQEQDIDLQLALDILTKAGLESTKDETGYTGLKNPSIEHAKTYLYISYYLHSKTRMSYKNAPVFNVDDFLENLR